MAFKLGIGHRLVDLQREEFLSHCRPEMIELSKSGQLLTEETIPERMNSYEAQLLMPLWSDELLIQRIEYYLKQVSWEFNETPDYVLPEHYNDAIKTKFIFILLNKFKEKVNKEN